MSQKGRARVVSVLAGVLILFALISPNQLVRFTPAAFARIPVEALLGVVLALMLPPRARRVLAVPVGLLLGLLTVVKIVDLGFFATLARPFDPILDWVFVADGVEFLATSVGRAGALVVSVGVVGLAVAVVVLVTLSVLRLAGLVARHDTAATGAVAGLAVAWVTCAALGVQIVPGTAVASQSAAELVRDSAEQVRTGLRDHAAFLAESAADPYRDVPADRLLTALRGKDVVLAFVESYGRDAIEDPNFAGPVSAVLDAGDRRLRAAGFASRSGFLTSPTAGGGSWLAHATLLSGLRVGTQQRYRTLVAGDRLTLNGAFGRAGWRTVGVMPGVTRDWPEGRFFGYDTVYPADGLGYRGPSFSWARMPDQYTLAAFQRTERTATGRPPVMAEIPLVSSHAPWAPIPRLTDWDAVGDGSVFAGMDAEGANPGTVWRDADRVRTGYRRSIEYSLTTLISYVETFGDDDLVLVFLGDHQPVPLVTGAGAGHDVPITIVARDPAVLDRISGWHWDAGLRPGPTAPVWPMSAFRDRFLAAFSPADP